MKTRKSTVSAGRKKRALRLESLCSRQLMAGDLTNPLDPIDVNDDSIRSARDALAAINYIARERTGVEGEALAPNVDPEMFPDANGDGKVSAADALRVINALAEGEEVPAPARDFTVEFVTTTVPTVTPTTIQLIAEVNNIGQISGPSTGQQPFEVFFELFDDNGNRLDFQESRTTFFDNNTRPFPFIFPRGLVDGGGEFSVKVTVDSAGGGPDQVGDGIFDELSEANNVDTIGLSVDGESVRFATPDGGGNGQGNGQGGNDQGNNLPNALQLAGLSVRGGSSPTVTYSANHTQGTLTVQPNGNVVLTDAQGNFIGEQFIGGIPKVLRVKLTGHGNDITVNGLRTRDDLRIEDKGVGNVLRLNNASIGDDFYFKGNNHSNRLELNTVHVDDVFVFDGNRGNDLLVVENSYIGDDFKFFGEDGMDALVAISSRVGDDAIVRGGDDNDLIAALDVVVRDVADIQGDDDFNVAIADAADVTARRVKIREFSQQIEANDTPDGLKDQVNALVTSQGLPALF